MDQEKPEIKMVPLQDIRIDVTPETVTLDAQQRYSLETSTAHERYQRTNQRAYFVTKGCHLGRR